MIYYSSFVMDHETRSIYLFHKDHHRVWQTAHTDYYKEPTNSQENDAGTRKAFLSAFSLSQNNENVNVVRIPLVSIVVAPAELIGSVYPMGTMLPWSYKKALSLSLYPQTRLVLDRYEDVFTRLSNTNNDIDSAFLDMTHALQ